MTNGQHQTLLENILKELKELNAKLSNVTTVTFQMPFNQETCEHDYPSVWHGTIPPVCGKCGKPAKNMIMAW